jgi:hypothetical protein
MSTNTGLLRLIPFLHLPQALPKASLFFSSGFLNFTAGAHYCKAKLAVDWAMVIGEMS